MPEGDSLRRVAERLAPLVGQELAVEAPNPRAASLGVAERIDGRRLDAVEAVGKHLLLTFEGGIVLRSHLRMKGRWRLLPLDAVPTGLPWLVLRGEREQAVLWHGPVLELGRGAVARLGPDILDAPPDLDGILARLRACDPGCEIGVAILDQRVVAGIGNMWRAEILHASRISPWARVGELSDGDLVDLLRAGNRLMSAGRGRRSVYRRAGRPCPRCGSSVVSRPQGEEARTAYWCPGCQAGTGTAKA